MPLVLTTSIEALWEGVTEHQFYANYYDKNTSIEIWRAKNISQLTRALICIEAFKDVGEAYGYFDLFTQFMDALFFRNRLYLFRRLGKIGPWSVCSCKVIQWYNSQGLTFDLYPNEGQPDDIRKYCQNNPDKYELIRPLEPLNDSKINNK